MRRIDERPPIPFEPAPGYRWHVLPDPVWRMTDGVKRCRHLDTHSGRCNARAEVEQDLSAGARPGGQWHPVCDRHALGRWIEGGRVVSWVLR